MSGARQAKALLIVSGGCDTDCIFCLRNEIRRRKPAPVPARVDFEALDAFLRASLLMRVAWLEIGGDEPTWLEPGLLEAVIRRGRALGFRSVRMVTNGVRLGQEKGALERFLDWGATEFALPLYGADARTHDAITQRPGSFEATTKAVAAIARTEGRALLHTVVLRQNERQLEAMASLAGGWGLSLMISPLRRRDPHVEYERLLPLEHQGPFSLQGPRAVGGTTLNLLEGQMTWFEAESEMFLREFLAREGLAGERLAKMTERLGESPIFYDARRFLELLESLATGRLEGFKRELWTAGSAARALSLGSARLAKGADEEAVEAFRDALGYKSNDAASNRAKEIARRLLESMLRRGRKAAAAGGERA